MPFTAVFTCIEVGETQIYASIKISYPFCAGTQFLPPSSNSPCFWTWPHNWFAPLLTITITIYFLQTRIVSKNKLGKTRRSWDQLSDQWIGSIWFLRCWALKCETEVKDFSPLSFVLLTFTKNTLYLPEYQMLFPKKETRRNRNISIKFWLYRALYK